MVHISHLMLQFSPENDGYLQCMLDEFSLGVSDVLLTISQHFQLLSHNKNQFIKFLLNL